MIPDVRWPARVMDGPPAYGPFVSWRCAHRRRGPGPHVDALIVGGTVPSGLNHPSTSDGSSKAGLVSCEPLELVRVGVVQEPR